MTGDARTGTVLVVDQQPTLTTREKDVLRWASYGFTSGETAEKMAVGHETVRKVRAKVLQKLEATSITQAVAIAVREGLIV